MAMISCLDLHKGQKVLDLGCGCSVVGIYGAKIVGEESMENKEDVFQFCSPDYKIVSYSVEILQNGGNDGKRQRLRHLPVLRLRR